jgi:hypothetical protein
LQIGNDTARADKLYRIVFVNAATGMVRLDGVPNLPAAVSPWVIGRKQRLYDLFLPAPGDAYRGGSPLAVGEDDPLVYGSVSVSAADDKTHTKDTVKWAAGRWGGPARYGNEGRVGAAATIFQVYRDKPREPELPTYSDDRLFTSPADYHSRSFFTFRWVARAGAKTHVLRALDDTLFTTDWLLRSTRTALNGSDAAHAKFFPPTWNPPTEDLARKNAAAALLNAIASLGGYAALSADAAADARLLLARLPGNEGFVWGEGLAERDWEIRRTRTALKASDEALFPVDWTAAGAANQQKRDDVAAALNGIASLAAYLTLSNNALRVLASLPGNEAAYSQLTIRPLDPGDPLAADVRGPDSAETYAPVGTLRAYVDSIDGRSSNRYFYRALNVNAVQTRGDLSLATPPVYCPDVMPPRAPVITKVTAGEHQITLAWASNREPDLFEYRIFRARSATDARDLRGMKQVAVVAADPDPRVRPATVTWTDDPVPGLVEYWYRVVAIDRTGAVNSLSGGNVSKPCPAVKGRAVDTLPPTPPVWVAVERLAAGGVLLAWQTDEPSVRCVVQRRPPGGVWRPVSARMTASAPPFDFEFTDTTALVAETFEYRIIAEDAVGNRTRDAEIRVV